MRWGIAVLLVLLVFLQTRLWVGEGSLAELTTIKKKIHMHKQENSLLQQRNELLTKEIQALKHSDEAIEEYARSKLGMIKQDETFYLVVEE